MADDDEPYHFTPVCDPTDIICEGSDAEETIAQIQTKRYRYEEHAKRIAEGRLPVLVSASLKGPFDKSGGWENPWRTRPKKRLKTVKENNRQKFGPDNMRSTRDSVSQKAADHKLGYLMPAAALAWCQATANTEAQQANGLPTNSMERSSNMGKVNLYSGLIGEDGASQHSSLPELNTNSQSENKYASMNSKGLASTKDSQRSHAPLWLKGSYVSRRARWDDNPIISPTPLPNVRRKNGTSKLSGPFDAQRVGSQRMPSQSRPRALNVQASSLRQDIEVGGEMRPRRQVRRSSRSRDMHASLVFTKHDRIALKRKVPDYYEDQAAEEPQESISAISFHHYGSVIKPLAPASIYLSNTISAPASQRSWRQYESPQRQEIDNKLSSKTAAREMNGQLYVKRNRVGGVARAQQSLEGVSFTTKVAPLCRDLEKFEFRKRGRLQNRNSGDLRSQTGDAFSKQSAPSLIPSVDAKDSFALPMSPLERSDGNSCNGTKRCISFPKCEESDDEWETALGETKFPTGYVKKLYNVPGSSKSRSPNRALPSQWCYAPDDRNDDNWETILGDVSRLETSVVYSFCTPAVLSSSPQMETEILKVPEEAHENSQTPLEADRFDRSWETMKDIPQRASIRSDNVPSLTTPMFHSTSLQHEHTPTSESTSGMRAKTSIKRLTSSRSGGRSSLSLLSLSSEEPMSPSRRSRFISQAATSRTPSKAPQGILSEVDGLADQNDICTQSANTTPTRSLKLPRSPAKVISTRKVLADAKNEMAFQEGSFMLITPHVQSRSSCGKKVQISPILEDEMEHIQKRLSQNGRSQSSQENDNLMEVSDVEDVSHRDNVLSELENDVSVLLLGAGVLVDDMKINLPNASQFHSKVSLPVDATAPGKHPEEFHSGEGSVAAILDDAIVDELERLLVETPNSLQHSGVRNVESQSPWITENMIMPTTTAYRDNQQVLSPRNFHLRDAEEAVGIVTGQSDWQPFQRSLILENASMEPLVNFETPLRSLTSDLSRRSRRKTADNDNAINNPWISTSLKKSPSKKPKKRVSFGFALTQENVSSRNPTEIALSPTRDIFPPEIDWVDDNGAHPFRTQVSLVPGSKDCFTSSRTFKRILPDKRASQVDSSPAPVEAMAEAFVAADQESDLRQEWPKNVKEHPQSSLTRKGSIWDEGRDGDLTSSCLLDRQANALTSDVHLASFNIDDAIGEANAFLEDWSVESELKKSRESDIGDHESNGIKRRRLFGIV